MAGLSISNAWNETTGVVKRNAQLLFPIAFLLVALPSAMMQAAMPVAQAGAAPEFGLLGLVLIPVVVVLSILGSLAISYLALRPQATGGDALSRGAKRLLPVLGAGVLLIIAFILLSIPFVLLFYVAAGGAAATAETMGGGAFLVMLVWALAFVALWVRLMLITPVAAGEDGGPVAIIRRSWNLTAGHFWKLLGFVVLIAILFLVVTLAITAVGGILIFAIAGTPQPGSVASFLMLLLSAVLNTVVTVYFTSLIARIYAQLSEGCTIGT